MTTPAIFDRKLLRQRLARAARHGDPPLFLLERAGAEMGDRLAAIERRFSPMLIMGAAPALIARALRPAAGLGGPCFAMRSAPETAAPHGGLDFVGDEELLPVREGAFGLIVSGLSLQLANDTPGALVQIRRALKPDGLFLGAVLGGLSLTELREAFLAAEMEREGGASPRVAPMADIRDYGALLQRAGFALPVADSDAVTVTYASPLALMQDLRAMGAANALLARRRMPLRRATLLRALEIYRERFDAGDGRVKATFEVIHLAGWGPHESQQKPLRPGSAAARLADALGVEEHRLKRDDGGSR